MKATHTFVAVLALILVLPALSEFPLYGQDPGWRNMGPGAGTVTSICEDAADSATLFMTTMRAGFYKSTDGGTNWMREEIGLPVARINNVVQDPDQPLILFAGTGRGVYKSIDRGESWSLSSGGEMDTTASFRVSINPLSPTLVYAASQGNGVYRSSNSGEFWTTASGGLPPLNYVDITVDPFVEGKLYVASQASGMFRSLNQGEVWEQKNSGLTSTALRSFVASPFFSGYIFTGTQSGGFFRSTNSGDLWSAEGNGLPQKDITSLAVLEAAPSLLLAGTAGRGIYSSDDGGDTFTPFAALLSHHTVSSLSTGGADRIYSGMNKDGLFISRDGGLSWDLANHGLTGGSVSAMAVPGGDPSYFYAGLRDGENDLLISTDWGATWQLRDEGLPSVTAVNNLWAAGALGTVYACTDSGVFMTADYGVTWTPRNAGLVTITSRIAGSTLDSDLLFVIASGIYKSTDGGGSWNPAGEGIVGSPLSVLISPISADTVYSGTKPIGPDGGGIYKSTDAGATWFAVNNGLELNESVFSLSIDPSDPSVIFAGTASGVFRSSNGGGTWFPRTNGLPIDFTSSDILIDAMNPQRLFTSSLTYGVYMSTNSGESWSRFNNDLDTLRVTLLTQNPLAPDTIFAATDGKGIYMVDLSPTGIEEGEPEGGRLPSSFALSQNFPNPFNPQTTITVSLGSPGEMRDQQVRVSLRIYDLRGRLVKTLLDGSLPAGLHRFSWDGRDGAGSPVSSGTYFAVLKTSEETVTRKMSLIR